MDSRRRVIMRTFAVALLGAVALVAVSCGAGGDGTYRPDEDAEAVTVNIDVSEKGYEPADVRIPAGPSIQLILRNRSADEFHYRVVGLDATEILWLAAKEEDVVREEGVTEEDHEKHHAKDFVAWRGTSPRGVKPTLKEVHAYAAGTQVDVVHFYALAPGTYQVSDPLHPDLKGTLTVVAP
ncbi:MAG: hypothetical protein EPO16_09950 [Dehalococcoidia bacterium]|nr:MAG: hypothetical protein EPO16_09950 [Dehalococcoidia bacterium]